MKTIHRTYSGVAKEPVLYVADQGQTEVLKGKDAEKFLKKLKAGAQILLTATSSTDSLGLQLAENGVKVHTVHFHSTGIDAGLDPKELAAAFSMLGDDSLRPFVARPDLAQLRLKARTRQAVLEVRKAARNRMLAILRDTGVSIEKVPSWMSDADAEQKDDLKSAESPITKALIKEASEIQECQVFTKVFGMKEVGVSVAIVVSCLGDISRFPQVSSLWHYCGQHVVNGKAPRRTRGSANDWNPEVRTALWNILDTGLKNNSPKIRNMYEEFKAAELETHDTKCPECKTKLGHCGARARRRVTKELLKEYYVTIGGSGQPSRETQTVTA